MMPAITEMGIYYTTTTRGITMRGTAMMARITEIDTLRPIEEP